VTWLPVPPACPGLAQRGHDAAPQDSERIDAGGGFGGLVLPAGAYVVKGGQVRWVPAVDVTIVVLASLSLWGCSHGHGPGRGGITAGGDPSR
jgi:hypothetical protein